MREKRAFTMVELIIVIITLAILAAYSIPRIKRDTRSEAINHILMMMRYTQNLALHDDMHLKDNTNWQRRFWRFEIDYCAGKGNGLYYNIVTDNNMRGKANKEETAIDPSNGKYTYWIHTKKCPKNSTDALMNQVSPNIFLTQKYGINSVKFESCTIYKRTRTSYEGQHLGFDNYGRAYKSYTASSIPNNWGVAITDCKIKFSFIDNSIDPFTVVVSKESGFIYLEENPNL